MSHPIQTPIQTSFESLFTVRVPEATAYLVPALFGPLRGPYTINDFFPGVLHGRFLVTTLFVLACFPRTSLTLVLMATDIVLVELNQKERPKRF